MKRSHSKSPEPCNANENLSFNAKRTKLSHEETGLLDLSDDVLLQILKNLTHFDLMALHLCCERLHQVCSDRTLWKNLDLRSKSLPLEELKKYVKFMQPITKLLAISGFKSKTEFQELHPDFLTSISLKCTKLEDFLLEHYTIPYDKIQITHFPKTLKKLSLKGCQIFKANSRQTNLLPSYLCKVDAHMPNLTCLILTNCKWLNSHSFMAISKVPNLKEVRLNSCYGLSEDIAYASLACRYGLKSLEVLDLRDTFVGDSVVSSFSHTSTLTEIYLECPGSETVQYEPYDNVPNREVLFVQIQRGPELVVYQDNHVAVELVNENDLNHLFVNLINNTDRSQISDRSICSLGLNNTENNREIILARDEVQLVHGRVRLTTNPKLKKLVVRNYTGVTNQILTHFILNGPRLEYLDVTGTSVTKEGLQNFKIQRPEVTLISSIEV